MTPEPAAVFCPCCTVMDTTALETAVVTASQSGAVPVEETVCVVEPVAMAVEAADGEAVEAPLSR